jgi:MraZ protein
MKPIYGEYECRLDSKGRFAFPSGLKKQLPDDQQKEFVLNRGLDDCLVLYPVKVWEAELRKIHSKNQYVAKNRAFARMFQSGALPVELDGSNRVLIPKRLAAHAKIVQDLIVVASFDRIEIWDKATYETWLGSGQYDMEALSEEVMGNLPDAQDEG